MPFDHSGTGARSPVTTFFQILRSASGIVPFTSVSTFTWVCPPITTSYWVSCLASSSVTVVAHVRHEYQHVAPRAAALRHISGAIACGSGNSAPRNSMHCPPDAPGLVVGHHADKPDPESRPGRRSCRAATAGRCRCRSPHWRRPPRSPCCRSSPQERLPVVEFMVAQRRHVATPVRSSGRSSAYRASPPCPHRRSPVQRSPASTSTTSRAVSRHASTADASRGKFCIFACMSFVDSNTSVLSRGAQAAAGAATATSPSSAFLS